MKSFRKTLLIALALTVVMLMVPASVSAATKVNLSKTTITLSASTYTYNGEAKTPTVKVVYKKKTLKKNTDYTVAYSNNTKAGKAKVTIKGKGKYTGTVYKYFKINGCVTKYYETMTSSPYYARDYFKIVYDGYTGKVKSVTTDQIKKDAFLPIFKAKKLKKTGTWTYRSVWTLTTPSIFKINAAIGSVVTKYSIGDKGTLKKTYRKVYWGSDVE